MSTDSEHRQPSFRFRDKFSRLKDRVKDKVKDKAIKHNITLFVHQNLTSNDTHEHSSHHGFRQHMHHYKDVLKNKTHYESIKDKIKDKIDDKFDLHHNKTYPKGFYDSLFSPETENDVYLQTALMCLWVIAVLSIIPTIIVIFLPAKKTNNKKTNATSNMIFFHVFLCELCYLTYILLAMINVSKDFRLSETFCDFANYGMYVTIPIMQFALLFLSLERLSKHFTLTMTWTKIFVKPYVIQVILCAIWIFLGALLLTFMFIKNQFNFSFIKEQIRSVAPPILGDVVDKLASRRYHCSIDGRLSSVFKTIIIILFIVLIVKPIVLSLGFNLLTPFCCKGKRKKREKYDDRRTTRLVTIFLLLNFFFSFPFYFVSMFKSIFTNIDSTKDTFSIILKICFILRITNIIFECLAFYTFERNSWNFLSKIFYYGTCKKFPIFNKKTDGSTYYTKDPKVKAIIKQTRKDSNDDHEETRKKPKKTIEPEEEQEDDDDDGAFVSESKKQSKTKKDKRPVKSEDKRPFIKPTKKQIIDTNEDETEKIDKKKSNSPDGSEESDDDDEEEEEAAKRKSQTKESEEDEVQPKSKSHRTNSETRIPNGASATIPDKHSEQPIRRRTPSPRESDVDVRQTPSPVRKHSSKPRPSSSERTRHRTKSPSSSSRPRTKPAKKSRQSRSKKPRKDRQTRILEMSDEV